MSKALRVACWRSRKQIAARKRGRPVGTVKTGDKVSTTIRFDPDLLAALKASGTGWQTRVNEVLREAVRRGQLASHVGRVSAA
jgi:uncharacterized protein (DUF4415 family)